VLKQLYDKSRLGFAIFWIVLYCVLMSAGDSLSSMAGIEKSVTLPIGFLLAAILFCFLKKHRLTSEYGLCRAKTAPSSMLYYLPAILLLTANLWYGVSARVGAVETLLYILSMFCVGFLEEVIFRGLLYRAMAVDNPRSAIIVSSLTFGIGHIVNLFNGSGAEVFVTLLQVFYAAAAGFMFVMIYEKTDSLIGCIVIHGVFNALSVFANEPSGTAPQIVTCVLLMLISGGYAVYLACSMKKTGETK